jgi:hypothetical protein
LQLPGIGTGRNPGILLKILQNRAFAMPPSAGFVAATHAIDTIDRSVGLGGGTMGLAPAFE